MTEKLSPQQRREPLMGRDGKYYYDNESLRQANKEWLKQHSPEKIKREAEEIQQTGDSLTREERHLSG